MPCPIRRINPVFHRAIETRKRPFLRMPHMAMLHRVEVDAIEVPLVIEVVADQVFPIAPLPDAAFPTLLLGIGARFGVGQAFGEGELDGFPAFGIGPIAGR
ncbi:hypothetical protein [Pseudomonas sp. DY-1]|uniref:hypothetical protein n=1 Tax=Pseudomonas sp. DY-1 TaxID=1755504 RepID=UPI0013C4AD8A|nr:hypothetical protein [Pseudomonas sp. DY-1]